ncbi:hypothetical protein J3F84DRAFT_367513 [Trichoderma pleuroticola]
MAWVRLAWYLFLRGTSWRSFGLDPSQQGRLGCSDFGSLLVPCLCPNDDLHCPRTCPKGTESMLRWPCEFGHSSVGMYGVSRLYVQ